VTQYLARALPGAENRGVIPQPTAAHARCEFCNSPGGAVLWQDELCRVVRVDEPDYVEQQNEWAETYQLNDPERFKAALDIVKQFQPLDADTHRPQNPRKPFKAFPAHVVEELQKKLGLEYKDKVYFWTTVGSMIDDGYGADAVVEIKGKEKGELPRYALLDAKLPKNTGTVVREKQRILFGRVPDRVDSEKVYGDFVADMAHKILLEVGLKGPNDPK